VTLVAMPARTRRLKNTRPHVVTDQPGAHAEQSAANICTLNQIQPPFFALLGAALILQPGIAGGVKRTARRCPRHRSCRLVEEFEAMLRVITRHLGNSYRLELYGLLGGDWVRLLEEQWLAILADLPSATVTVVLSDVEFIDPDGEGLLRRMADGGVAFVVSGCMNRYVIEKLHPRTRPTKDSSARHAPSGTEAASR
jgi:hypothetical protein